MTTSVLLGEEFPSKVGAVFGNGDEARRAAEALVDAAGINARQIRVLPPRDPAMERKLEPETEGIARTLVKAHVVLGSLGVLVGLIVATVLVLGAGEPFATSPGYTFFVAVFFGGIAGLLLGGLVSMRPDHDRLISWVEDATRGGKWFVLVHARNGEEEQRAKDALERMSEKVVGTF